VENSMVYSKMKMKTLNLMGIKSGRDSPESKMKRVNVKSSNLIEILDSKESKK